MQILAVDDQPIILKSITHKLKSTGYNILTANSGEEAIETFLDQDPDLILLDMNMPNGNGFDVIRYVRQVKESEIPIIVMSGVKEEDKIVKAFDLGVDDYIQKPVGLNEVLARVNRLLKQKPTHGMVRTLDEKKKEVIHKSVVGVVIPCYNEADRLKSVKFTDFAKVNHGYKLCFVNDGSKDNTLEVLHDIRVGHEDYITVYDCAKNGGKAEAVRQGIHHMLQDEEIDYVGFLDADLSTNFLDFEDLVNTIEDSEYKIVSGSRIARMGANIAKESSREIISITINKIIQRILGMPFKDTQCGAKVFTRDAAEFVFQEKFLTRWLFDVEIFMRMKKKYGAEESKKYLCEQPLNRWVHEDGSKLSMNDSIKIVYQIFQIAFSYR